jgi:hypothetical protein
MTDFPVTNVRKKDVVRAGKLLRGALPEDPDRMDEYRQAFRIAYDWRDSHYYPMRRIRYELVGKIRRLGISAITAARIKRMPSIRKKLAASTITLVQIQDLGGCRAIAETVDGVNALVRHYAEFGSAHVIRVNRSYIEEPAPDGYRSHHLVIEFCGIEEEAIYDKRRVEIQVRSRLQHIWATAVEAVGAVRGEDLKRGEGDPDWLRLFVLMSSEMAAREACPAVEGTGDAALRREELRDLNRRLGALEKVNGLNYALRTSVHARTSTSSSSTTTALGRRASSASPTRSGARNATPLKRWSTVFATPCLSRSIV